MESRRFTTPALDGVQLHAVWWGEASRPALVLLHGGGANAHWWDAVAARLSQRFRVVALDFRGHGDSDWPDARESGAFERDLAALLEHLGAPGAALIGHSMGAHVALSHAARHPETRAVVAVEPSRGGGHRDRRRMRLALAARRSYRSRDEALARFRLLPPGHAVSEAVRRGVAEHSVREEADGRFGFKFDPRWFSVPPLPRPDLSGTAAPVLVVRGALSTLLTAEGASALVAEIPRARLVEVADAGHNVHVEQPDAFLAAVLPFLASVGTDRAP
jgi:pimeloyl-ACP methyl ester carboxylesterase